MKRQSQPRSAQQERLHELGLTQVALWCRVSEAAVYKWLARRPTDSPVPPQHLPAIVAGCRAAGIALDPRDLWPALPQLDQAA